MARVPRTRIAAGAGVAGVLARAACTRRAVAISLASLLLLAPPSSTRPKKKPSLGLYRTKLIPKIAKVESCPEKENSLRINNVSMAMDRYGGDVLDVGFEMLRNAKQISMFHLTVDRCTGSASNCEHVNQWDWRASICELMTNDHAAWTSFMQSIHPPIKCPMLAGSYSIHNASVDLDMADNLYPNMERFIWMIETRTFDEVKALYACAKWVAELRRIRIKAEGILG